MDASNLPTKPGSGPTGYWRAAAYFFAVLLVMGAAAGISMYEQFTAQLRDLQQKVQKTAQLEFVAVLLDDKGEPAMLLTQSAGDGYLQLQRLNNVVEGPEDSLQLWAQAEVGPPQSLGVLPSKLKTARLPASEQTLAGAGRLGLSVESKGGVAQGQGPRLPYLFSGSVIRKAL